MEISHRVGRQQVRIMNSRLGQHAVALYFGGVGDSVCHLLSERRLVEQEIH